MYAIRSYYDPTSVKGGKTLNDKQLGGASLLPPGGAGNGQNAFYFYNPVTVSYGKAEFQKKWGNIKLKDNWRFVITSYSIHYTKLYDDWMFKMFFSLVEVNGKKGSAKMAKAEAICKATYICVLTRSYNFV